MPKKTRREKVLADLHKRQNRHATILLSNEQEPKELIQDATPSEGYRFTYSNSVQGLNRKESTSGTNPRAIHHDLLKTIALATGAIALEFFLYWYFKSR